MVRTAAAVVVLLAALACASRVAAQDVQLHVQRAAPARVVAPQAADHRFERVLAEAGGEILGVGVAVGVGVLMGSGGGTNGMLGGALGGAILGWWLIAPFTVQMFGAMVDGRGSLAGSVVGHVITGLISGLVTATVFLASQKLEDTALAALIAVDGVLLLAGPIVGYEVSDAEARRSPAAPSAVPGVALLPGGGALAHVTFVM